MTTTLPKGYKFPPKRPDESYKDYAIRIKVHPSCKERVSLHPDDIDIKDVTDEVLDQGFIIAPKPEHEKKAKGENSECQPDIHAGDSHDEKSND